MKGMLQYLSYWLASSNKQAATRAHVVSCSATTLTLSEDSSPLQVGSIFLHVDQDSSNALCRDQCSVLFREITKAHGSGIYKTKLATFEQVYPTDMYESEYADMAIESMLPTCASGEEHEPNSHHLESTMVARRSRRRQLGAVQDEFDAWYARKKDNDETDDHKEDDFYDDDWVYEKDNCFKFWDATKEFVFDMYCIIRNLDCDPYDPNPGGDDDHDDKYSSDSKDEHKPTRMLRVMRRLQSAVEDAFQSGTSFYYNGAENTTTVAIQNTVWTPDPAAAEEDPYTVPTYGDMPSTAENPDTMIEIDISTTDTTDATTSTTTTDKENDKDAGKNDQGDNGGNKDTEKVDEGVAIDYGVPDDQGTDMGGADVDGEAAAADDWVAPDQGSDASGADVPGEAAGADVPSGAAVPGDAAVQGEKVDAEKGGAGGVDSEHKPKDDDKYNGTKMQEATLEIFCKVIHRIFPAFDETGESFVLTMALAPFLRW